MTIVVVRLSSTAERKKVINPTIQSKVLLLSDFILVEMMAKPSWASINSTIVIVPIRKNKIPAISPIWVINWPEIFSNETPEKTYNIQQITPVIIEVEALSILIFFSNTIKL
jgi:hypothetical protein